MKTIIHAMLVSTVVAALACGCTQTRTQSSETIRHWRASNAYGDKPGNGIQLTLEGSKLSGKFFLLDPNQPHSFAAGSPYQMTIQPAVASTHDCTVTFAPDLVDQFSLILPPGFPKDRFTATIRDRGESTGGIQFKFIRVR